MYFDPFKLRYFYESLEMERSGTFEKDIHNNF